MDDQEKSVDRNQLEIQIRKCAKRISQLNDELSQWLNLLSSRSRDAELSDNDINRYLFQNLEQIYIISVLHYKYTTELSRIQ